ncbi:lipoteichoic acid stability factor AuxB [Staphylococcus americanisciuri]|uniref:DUF4064 domain-containing protein n=1 Tax=Staphylococcus americanisciuri TaxID=2973940 RepID=A0ABT2F3D5_9STAP|nr:DUF4064 domain-containing protein [Staphylococcus americanisciuri]MCS4486718.1 DUF4064 domain-containing protein [Staphylococcus americanisciuri]
MTGDVYTQVRRPVNRLAEKILGWLSWIFLLGTTIVAMFFGLVLFSNESSIQSLEAELANNATVQDLLTNYNMTATELVIQLQNGVWAFIVYLIVCLLISFLALISMNHRIISGLLFLGVAILTLPLIFMLVPIFFFIIALMMFGRRERLETVPVYDSFEYQRGPIYEPTHSPEPESVRTQPVAVESHHDVQNEVSESADEPTVLSRSAKYHHKQTSPQENITSQAEDDAVTLDDSVRYEEVDNAQQQTAQADNSQTSDYAYTYNTQEANDLQTKDTLKQLKKEEKAQQKAERKAKKAYEKEQRKNRPSASLQRRQNYQNRMKMNQERTEQAKSVDTHTTDDK